MTKFILFSLIFSLPAFAQNLDELTLESTTAPMVIEDSAYLNDAPETEEPIESADPTVDVPAILPGTTPLELTNESREDKVITDVPEEDPGVMTTEMADAIGDSLETPNPLAEKKQPRENPSVDNFAPVTSPEVSTPVISTREVEDERFIKHRASHWVTTFAFEGMKYELPFEFEGRRRNIRDRDQELYGGRLGFGGQIHLGAGFFTTSMVESFYVGTLFTKNQEAGPQVAGQEVGSIKRTSGLWGAEVSQNLGYIFEFRTKNPFLDEWAYLTFEPFVEAGLGVARAYNAVNYRYNSGDSAGPSQVNESYKRRIRDELTNARIGAGFNLTGRGGFFMTARVSINRYDITKREIDTFVKQDDQPGQKQPSIEDKDVKIDPITVFTLGGGYKF